MRSSVAQRQSQAPPMPPSAKPSVSAVMTTQQRPRNIVCHPYKNEDSSGSERQQRIERKSVIPAQSETGRARGSVAYTKKSITVAQKRRALQMYKYINPLARLDYEDKMEQVHTKYTKLTKESVMKKIKAKNRIAEFEDEDEEIHEGFDQLIDYKFGKEKDQKIYFEKEEIIQYEFCEFCDMIHNDHPEAHIVICEKKRRQEPEMYSPYSPNYTIQSLYRIKLVIEKIKSPQFQQLHQYLIELESIIVPGKSTMLRNRPKLLSGIKQLKHIYCNDSIFVKIIAKVCYLVQQL